VKGHLTGESMSANRVRHVAVLVESSHAYGRAIIEGVLRYNTERTAWSIYLEPRGFEAPPPWFATWKGDGIIARFPAREETVLAKRVPIIDLYGTLNDTELPHVAGDNALIGRLVFDHFWERGIRSFAFYAWANRLSRYDEERQNMFCDLARAAGCACSVFTSLGTGTSIYDWEKEQQRHVAWLQALPKPVGIFLFNDIPAHRVLDLCRDAEVQVPDEVAIVTVGNDPILCTSTVPPASSVEHDGEQIGYEAATLLDRMMQGGQAPREPIRVAPRGLVVRLSSDVLAVEDPDVAAALRYIHEHACGGLRVSDLVQRVAVSQSVLERKFLRLLGRAPKAEMLRVQLGRARQLLSGSNLPLREVARQCGFESDKYFSDAFLRGSGLRPLAYRTRHRDGDDPSGGGRRKIRKR
jgi:LacI family transcriptional regulator